jgi:choline dehydrogenase-like flavoprotein
MIIDLDQQDSDPFKGRVFDICICGAGVAGITLALALSKNFNVLLLEAGGTEYSSESQLLYQGTSVGREYFPLLTTRLRFLGGTSNHWGGWCGTLDAHDFERKTYVEYSGWPIGFHDLEPYAGGARSILDVSEEYQSKPTASQLAFLDRIAQSGDFTSFDMLWSHPVTRFREKYKAEIEERPNLTCFVNPNLTRLTIVDNLTRVREAEVRNYHRREFKVSARRFVLATGGIENPRILLNCDHQVDGGIGNRRGLVGRFFCEHPTANTQRIQSVS